MCSLTFQFYHSKSVVHDAVEWLCCEKFIPPGTKSRTHVSAHSAYSSVFSVWQSTRWYLWLPFTTILTYMSRFNIVQIYYFEVVLVCSQKHYFYPYLSIDSLTTLASSVNKSSIILVYLQSNSCGVKKQCFQSNRQIIYFHPLKTLTMYNAIHRTKCDGRNRYEVAETASYTVS